MSAPNPIYGLHFEEHARLGLDGEGEGPAALANTPSAQDWAFSPQANMDGGSSHFNHWTGSSAFQMTFATDGGAATSDGAVFPAATAGAGGDAGGQPPPPPPQAQHQHPHQQHPHPQATASPSPPPPQQAPPPQHPQAQHQAPPPPVQPPQHQQQPQGQPQPLPRPPPQPQQTAQQPPSDQALKTLLRPKMVASVSADQVPSTAIYVKNLDSSTTETDLKVLFEPYLQGHGQILIVPYLDRGVAFVDLGSTEAVARAVSASRTAGIKLRETLITVEPSKKPVRPSGLRAMSLKQVRKAHHHVAGSPSNANHNGVNNGHGPAHHGSHPHKDKDLALANPAGLHPATKQREHSLAGGGGGRNGTRGLATSFSRDGSSRALTCWCVQESLINDLGGQQQQPQKQDRRIVAVFVQKEDAIAAANALWAHLKANTGTIATYCYQEIREDAQNGNFYRRLDTGAGQEVRQVTVEAPAFLNPVGMDLRDCTSTFLHDHTHHMNSKVLPTPGGWQAAPAAASHRA